MDLIRKDVKVRRLAVVAAEDEHSLTAVMRAVQDKVVQPLLFGDADSIKRILEHIGADLSDDAIIDVKDPIAAAAKAVSCVKEGAADVLMKGHIQTADIMRAVIAKEKGLLKEGNVISMLSLNDIPGYHKILVWTDMGIVLNPNLEQKKAIIENAVRVLMSYGYDEVKVGVLCAVENVNPKMQETVDAAALKEMSLKGEIKNCVIDGPISMDIALSAEKAKLKDFDSKVAGDPDILLFPNVLTGNITAKAVAHFVDGSASVIFAVGAQVPLIITSRGTSIDGKYRAILGAAAASS
jgi:phosphate butyryltransferase